MGFALIDKVIIHWGNLPGNAYKVLMVMAKTGMDADLVPVYFGGWERLAMTGLGRRDWPADDDDSDEAVKSRRASFEIVRQSVRDLKTAGAIKVKRQGRRGKVAHYSLHLDAPNLWITPLLPKDSLGSNARNPWVERKESLRTTQGKAGVEEQRRNQKEQGEEISSSPAVPHQGARSPEDKPEKSRLEEVRRRADAEIATRTG